MTVDRTALWIVMALCAALGVVVALRFERRSAAPPPSALARVGRYASAALTGVGAGFGTAGLILVAASLLAQAR